jgi:predicted amidohydrolase
LRLASKASLSVALAAALAAPATAAAKTVRVFAMGPKLDVAWFESRDTFRDKVFALADKRLRGPDKPPIQEGADDFASHLLGPSDPARPVETARDLVLWPEDVAFFTMYTGPRGEQSRAAPETTSAIASLAGTYGAAMSYYAERFPAAAARAVGGRTLLLALTDVHARVGVETFAEMADRYDVYLHAGTTMAREWKVICTDREAFNAASPPRLPGGVRCDEEAPDRVQRLGEPGRDYAYEATSPTPSVLALLFDPDGRLISKQVKTYITPLELGPPEGQVGLDTVPGRVSDGVSAVPTPVGTLGFVTSKDAWMPDLLQKLDQRHVDLLVQPEFFLGNLVIDDQAMWNPDVLRASVYNDVLRHPSMESGVLAEMVGNLHDLSADHQQHIVVKPRTGREPFGYLVGQPPGRGYAGVAPWVVPDPADPDESVPERRARLAEAGRKLLPGSGVACPDPAQAGPCENGHVEGVLWHDVEIARQPRRRRFGGRHARTRFSPSHAVSPSGRPQRNASVARRGRHVLAAFEERRGDRDQVFLVRSADGGRTWSRRVRPSGRPPGATDEWWPAVALGSDGRATVAWVDRSGGRERVYFARSADGGRSFAPPAPLDAAPPAEVAQWKPALAHGPGDVVHAAFVDERTTQLDDGLPQAGLWYARIVAGTPEPARRLDTGTPEPLATKLDNAWAPSVSARGERVLVSWIDFRAYDWDVYARASGDRGVSFGEQTVVNDTPAADEALNDSPQATLGPSRAFVVWTDWRKRNSTGPLPHPAYDVYIGTPGASENRQVDQHGGEQLSTFSPAACTDGHNDVLVAFQDASRGQNDIRIVRMRGGTTRGPAHRVDDAGSRGGNAWRPRLGCWNGRVLAAWEDERDGPPQIYAATAAARRLP